MPWKLRAHIPKFACVRSESLVSQPIPFPPTKETSEGIQPPGVDVSPRHVRGLHSVYHRAEE